MQARTSSNDDEIMGCLDLVLKASKLGLIHEAWMLITPRLVYPYVLPPRGEPKRSGYG